MSIASRQIIHTTESTPQDGSASTSIHQQEDNGQEVKVDIPQSTYRFQFNRDFTFDDARQLIPYLQKLGITHCYASPLLAARPGSMHGYDIVDHGRVNPEIGSDEAFEQFCQTLAEHQMGLIVDIVPNHMGIGSDNAWWMDVLENGQLSEYACYFDIDWTPLKIELQGKVLLPVLGDQYGYILGKGEFEIKFSVETGTFSLYYFDHFWPINPSSYPMLLKHALPTLDEQLEKENLSFLEYQSVITALENLPANQPHPHSEDLEIRRREKTITLKRLSDLCQNAPEIAAHIQAALVDFNNTSDNDENAQRLHTLLECQAYRLAFWRVASDEINYRRFFDVNDLAGLNMENPKVFLDTHRLLLQWVAENKVSGFRIDHPDGLYDPAEYFKRLQIESAKAKSLDITQSGRNKKPFYIVVEKILATHENLPETWTVYGTSGYEFGNRLNGLLIHKESEEAFSNIYAQFIGSNTSIQTHIYECKRLIMKESLSSELNVLANKLRALAEQNWKTRDFTLNNLRQAITEVVAAFPVYRTYVTPDDYFGKKDRDYIQWAIQLAKKRSSLVDISIYDFIHQLLLLDFEPGTDWDYICQATYFTLKFQQFTGPVMAKGLEDTCFYRYNRLVSLNEVGGELDQFGLSIPAFHRQTQDQVKLFPHTMLNTSTHDSKRSEDFRARISVLSEIPETWAKNLERWSRVNRIKKSIVDDLPVPDANTEYLIYQILIGIWPFQESALSEADINVLKERLNQYLLKASREAKLYTSWLNNHNEYEEGLVKFIDGLLDQSGPNTFLDEFLPFQKEIAFYGMLNALTQTVLKFTLPGVPDIYQGNELFTFSLVDPDNRQPVDYQKRQAFLDALPLDNPTQILHDNTLNDLLEDYASGQLKLWITAITLRYRRAHDELFSMGSYLPVDVSGHGQDHLLAFLRQDGQEAILVLAPHLLYTLNAGNMAQPLGEATWKDTQVQLPAILFETGAEKGMPSLKNLFTGEEISLTPSPQEGVAVAVSKLLQHFPVGLFSVTIH